MPSGKQLTRGKIIGALVALLLIVVAGFIASDIARRARAMRVSSASSSDIAQAKAGARVEPVVRIEAHPVGGFYVADVLQPAGGTDFREGEVRLEFAVDPAASFAMGAAPDLKPGAVAQVRGVLDGRHRLHADRIVLLTRVVRIAGRR